MLLLRLLAVAVVLSAYGDQFIIAASSSDCKADVVFVLDNSGSISDTPENQRDHPDRFPNWGNQLTFTKNLVDHLNVGLDNSHVGVVEFGHDGTLQFDLKTHYTADAVKKAVDQVPYKGLSTKTVAGVKLAHQVLVDPQYGRRPAPIPKVMILITDGKPNAGTEAALLAEVDKVRTDGIRLVVVAIGAAATVNETLLRAIATSDNDYIRVDRFDQLDSKKDLIVNADTCKPPPWPTTTAPPPTTTTPPPTTTTPPPTTTTPPPTTTTPPPTTTTPPPTTTTPPPTTTTPPPTTTTPKPTTTTPPPTTTTPPPTTTTPPPTTTPKPICTVDAVLIIDNSASVAGKKIQHDSNPSAWPNWGIQLNFVKSLVDVLKVRQGGSHVGVVNFGTDAYLNFDLKQYFTPGEVKSGIDSIEYKSEWSNTYTGLKLARQLLTDSQYGKRADSVPKLIVLVTDGTPNRPYNYSIVIPEEVAEIKQAGIRIVVVAVGSSKEVNDTFMRTIATSDANYIRVDNFATLASDTSIKDLAINEASCKAPPRPPPPPGSNCKADIVFVVDNTKSVASQYNWDLQKAFIKLLVSKLNVGQDGAHIALVDFGESSYLEFDLKAYFTAADVNAAVDRLKYKGEANTNTYGAIRKARNILSDSGYGKRDASTPKVIFLITAGIPNKPESKEAAEITLRTEVVQIKNSGIRIIVVGVGSAAKVNEKLLRIVATSTDKNYARVDDFTKLTNAKDLILNEETCAPLPPPLPNPTANCRADIVFVVDSSGSISSEVANRNKRPDLYPNWDWQKIFIKNLVNNLNVGTTDTHIGYVSFAKNYVLEFDLKKYYTAAEVNAAVDRVVYTAGGTNTFSGIRVGRNILTENGYGKRDQSVPKVIVLITDGNPNWPDGEAVQIPKVRAETDAIKQSGIRIVTVAVGGDTYAHDYNINEDLLYQISTNKKSFVRVDSFDRLVLNNAKDLILNEETCTYPPRVGTPDHHYPQA